MGVGGYRHSSAALLPGMSRYPLYRRRDGPRDRFGQVRKIVPLPGFDPQTAQLPASHHTGCTTKKKEGQSMFHCSEMLKVIVML
jgi:hypothetical protein